MTSGPPARQRGGVLDERESTQALEGDRPTPLPGPRDPWPVRRRMAFIVVWVVVQFTLVLTADRRPDGAFGFRMFPESSTLRVSLYRELRGPDGAARRVRVDQGRWVAGDARGVKHAFAWTDWVRRPELGAFDQEISASYGVEAQLSRFSAALDDLAAHVSSDCDTERFVLEISVRKNGREPYTVEFVSPRREEASRKEGG